MTRSKVVSNSIRQTLSAIRKYGPYQEKLRDLQIDVKQMREGLPFEATTKDAIEWVRNNVLKGYSISFTSMHQILKHNGIEFETMNNSGVA